MNKQSELEILVADIKGTVPLLAISSLIIPTLIFKFGWGEVISGLPCALDVYSVMLR